MISSSSDGWARMAIMTITIFFVVIAVAPFIFSYLSTLFFRFFAHKTGILDKPNGDLKNHERPVAYLGGVAIFIAAAAVVFFYLIIITMPPDLEIFNLYHIGGLFLLLLVGLIDDIFSITPLQKLVGQFFACVCFVYAGLYFHQSVLIRFLPSVLCIPEVLAPLGVFLSVWWMLSIINAINLLDIMDGLATTVAFIALLGMGLLIGDKAPFLIVMVVCFLSILVGFFLFNKPKASIYLGDAGSLFLGGVLATTPFLFGWGSASNWQLLLMPIFILCVPIIELCSLIIIRTSLGIPVYYGSPHHFALYLKRKGWSIKKILRVTGFVGVCFPALFYSVAFFGVDFIFPVILYFIVGGFFLLICL